eukprot:CAMPEP_0176486142 /NCGR_PEP_ID=MMETSP0200_2-20121128/5412_1 /TAXON_ID=947934 /ORGANISM="Chaetoceros sp., Strain GSL56" /LENGTH=1269 /DNA_ID=CAMNT_0017882827 /DNA_START=298 /DNA_END=4107 /DNA_ORIENTATION=-
MIHPAIPVTFLREDQVVETRRGEEEGEVQDDMVLMNEDDILPDDHDDDDNTNNMDRNPSSVMISSTHESNDDVKRYPEENASVRVAIRVRPLLFNEDQHESLQLFASSSSSNLSPWPSSSSTMNLLEDTTATRVMKSKSWSQSTMTTVPESPTSHSDALHYQNYQMLQVGDGDMAPTFTFDHVFPSSAGQEQVYDTCVIPLVESCLEGYNATVLAYGQTGSGKTHTILGSVGGDKHEYDGDGGGGEDVIMEEHDQDDEGVIPRALKDIFRGLENLQRNSILSQQEQADGKKVDASSSYAAVAAASATAPTPGTPSGTKPFEYCIKIQFVELYGEEIRDLLVDVGQDEDRDGYHVSSQHYDTGRPKMRKVKTSGDLYSSQRNKITIRDGKIGEGAELIGVERYEVKSAQEAMSYLQMGLARRVVGKTAMNVHSSRSHAIFTAVIHQTVRRYLPSSGGVGGGQSNITTTTTTTTTRPVGEKLQVEMKTSKMHFVDLCGSERVKRAQTAGKRLKEGIDINKGLLALGNVISALGKSGPKAHVPYRDSKLTRILKGSLGGNHKTLMIACVSPSLSNTNETTNTLRYANRAKNIKNNAKINVDPQHQVVNELRDQVAALAAELLRMRNIKKIDEDDDFPFSIDFLNALVRGGDVSVWRQKEGLRHSASMNVTTQLRPSTSPVVSVVTPERTLGRESYWNRDFMKIKMDALTEAQTIYYDNDDDWDANSAEDPELAKNIESYDFALATLRHSVSQKMARQMQTSVQTTEPVTVSLENPDDYGFHHDESEAHEYENDAKDDEADIVPIPPSPPSALKKIRNIDELYEYLNDNTYIDENGKIVDDEGTIVSEVVQSHVLKLEEAITQNEKILKEMETSHEIFELMKSDNMEKLAEIETELQIYRKERDSLSSVHSLLDDESQHSKGLEKALAVKDKKIAELLEEREEVLMLKERSNDNLKSMEDLKKSISVMKRQHSNLSQIKSRPLSNDKLSSFDADDNNDTLQSPNHDAMNSTCKKTASSTLISRTDSMDKFLTPTIEKDDYQISPDYFSTPRSRFSTWETDESPNFSDIDERLMYASKNAHKNSLNSEGRRASLGKIPRFLETPLDSTNHSSISLLETTALGSDHGVEISRTPRFSNRRRSVTLDTNYEVSTSSKFPRSNTNDSTQSLPTRRLRGPRGSRAPSISETEPLSYSKMLIKREELTMSTNSTPRSVFDVVDESISRGRQRTDSGKLVTDVDYDSGGEDHDWCGAGILLDTLRDFFGLKNPVLRKWEI